jgi:cellulose biosynthesis protein BcsQ
MNRKGGVGKTSTVHHLGGTLARRGLRVLLVDVDSQASLTQGLLGPEAAEALDPAATIAAVMDESGVVSPRDLVRPTPFPNLHLIPGSEAAERFNVPDPWDAGLRQLILRDALDEAGEGFDLVLIDCPPLSIGADASVISRWVDGVLVVIDLNASTDRAVREALRQLEAVKAPVIGLLLNRDRSAETSRYEYYTRPQSGEDERALTAGGGPRA